MEPKHAAVKFNGIYFIMGDFKKSVAIQLKHIKESEQNLTGSISEQNNSKKVKYVAYGNLVTYYNYLGKLDSAIYYIDKIKNENENFYNNFYDGFWYSETFTLILKREYDLAIARMEKSKDFINQSAKERYNADYYYAVCYQKKRDYKKSMDYAEAALKNIVILISFQNYELELYKIASENAQQLGLTEKENFYLKKYNEGAQKINYQEKAAFMAKLYDQDVIKPLNKELEAKEKKTFYLWSGLAVVFSLSVCYVGYSTYKSRKDKKHFDILIARLEKEKIQYNQESIQIEIATEILETESTDEFPEIPIEKNVNSISPETEKKILKKLENFERKQQFLATEVSLGTLSQDFKTNTAYITYVIKKHKNTNLSGYVNKLRIDYIIHKLKFNSEYMNYKIEYLAQESGFASYSTFKRIFTKETGIDPSKFIGYLKKSEEFQH